MSAPAAAEDLLRSASSPSGTVMSLSQIQGRLSTTQSAAQFVSELGPGLHSLKVLQRVAWNAGRPIVSQEVYDLMAREFEARMAMAMQRIAAGSDPDSPEDLVLILERVPPPPPLSSGSGIRSTTGAVGEPGQLPKMPLSPTRKHEFRWRHSRVQADEARCRSASLNVAECTRMAEAHRERGIRSGTSTTTSQPALSVTVATSPLSSTLASLPGSPVAGCGMPGKAKSMSVDNFQLTGSVGNTPPPVSSPRGAETPRARMRFSLFSSPSSSRTVSSGSLGEPQAVKESPPFVLSPRRLFGSRKSKAESAVPSGPSLPPITAVRGDVDMLVSLVKSTADVGWNSPALVDYWSTRPVPPERWQDGIDRGKESLVSPRVFASGYRVESCWASCSHDCPELDLQITVMDSESDFPFYRDFLSSYAHDNFVALLPSLGPCVLSLESPTPGRCCKCILRTEDDDKRFLLPPDRPLKHLEVVFPAVKDVKLKKARKEIIPELVSYEAGCLRACYKFGVLYCPPGPVTEDELFRQEGGHKGYEDFLDTIGERISLKGWSKYKGGLDVSEGVETGEHSLFAQLGRYQIMFHVATMLPRPVSRDGQCLERKRHVGNDVVAVVFKDRADDSDCFDPMIINSHFLYCVIVVSPEPRRHGDPTRYRVHVSHKPGVPPCPPFLPDDPVFEQGPTFRNFLLTKSDVSVINAERSAVKSDGFASLKKARRTQLQYFMSTFS